MFPERINLADELLRERERDVAESALMEEVHAILTHDESRRKTIKQRLEGKGPAENGFDINLLETHRIFHRRHIRRICIEYRLRFLDSLLFKGTLPREAVSKINTLEKAHNITLSGFKIVAPSKLFHLKNYDDPLLFAPIGNGYYYLIHKWGNDMNPYRKWMVRPMRDLGSLVVFLVVASGLFTWMVTETLFEGDRTGQFALVAFLFTFKSFCGIALYYCFWKGKNFNTAIWESEYYNK